jgi:ATP-dependent helicase/nuclease subunit A
MNWTKEQEQAIYKKDSNILVAAAAGSGKTAVLVERIINKIINEKIDIDRLLVVTFTNAAASEMRERILNSIYKIIDGDDVKDEATINHLQRQITLLNKANICTIDSFCLDVIKNNFFEIEISPNFRIADTAEIDLLKQEVLEKIFEEKYENHDKDFEKLIKTYTSYRDDTPLKDMILKIYTYIESNPFPLKWLNEQIEKFNIKDVKQDFSNTEWGKILLENMKEELEDCIKKLKAEERRLSFESELDQYERVINSDISQLEMVYGNLENWDKAYSLINNVEFLKWPVSRKITNPEKDRAKALRDKVTKDFKAKRTKIFTANSEDANNDLIEMYEILSKLENLIVDFDKEFSKNKRDRNIVDFSDVEHLALKILVKIEGDQEVSSEIAKKYQEKFIEIAIDEYQDSNLVQEYILTSISNGKNIFMVGDVKQSIYKFRQAMPDLFLSKYKNYSENETNENGLKIKLFKNFRSRKNVLDFTNLIFENIMGQKIGEIEYTEEEYLNLGANFEESKEELVTEVDILDVSEESNLDEEKIEEPDEEFERIEDIELEAKFVAQKIRNLIDSKFQVYDNKKGIFRDIRFKDIVILLRSTKNKANVFEKELTSQNINVYSDTSQEYLESYEIQVIMDLLKIIDNPYQDIPLVHVMLSCIGMFTEDDLLEIRLCDQNDDFYMAMLKSRLSVREDLKEKIDIFLNKVEDFRDKNKYMDLDELIWNIYEETGFLNYVGLMPNGNIRVANLKMLFERAKQYESASFKGLFNFINFIERIKMGSGDLGAAKLIGENEDVVRIMSIHKSKGLEFPVVFLSCTGSGFNMMDLNNDILLHQKIGIGVKYIDYDKQIKYDTISKLALREKLLEENLSEEMRILYVALTRAKEKIYVTGIKKDFEKNKEKMSDLVDIYKKENGKINPILIKKYKNYIDWILLVYMYNFENTKEIMKVNTLKRREILKDLKTEEEEKIDIFKLLEENSKNVTDEEILELKNKLIFEYKFKGLSDIPTKESVTNIVHKNVGKEVNLINEEEPLESKEDFEKENEITFPKPKFLIGTEEEKISSAKRGTLIHLCMKNLQFGREYNLDDVKELINDLEARKIITDKEKESINPWVILKFTKSNIWKELKEAKEYHKEEPFYINIPANEVMKSSLDENILVQGIIDLYYVTKDDELVLLDYKTDFINEGEEQILIDRHKPQLMLYKRALESGINKKVDKIYIYSTKLGKKILIES